MAAPRTYKPKVHVVLDIETLSTDKHAAIVEIGAVIALGYETQTFHIALKPSQFAGTEFASDQETWDWHNKIHPGYLAELESTGVTIQEALLTFTDWLAPFAANFELHLWSQGKDFDFPILDFALAQCGHKSPWAYSRVHCLRDLVWLNPGSRITSRPEELPAHTALNDALFETMQLRKTVAGSDWLGRLFK